MLSHDELVDENKNLQEEIDMLCNEKAELVHKLEKIKDLL